MVQPIFKGKNIWDLKGLDPSLGQMESHAPDTMYPEPVSAYHPAGDTMVTLMVPVANALKQYLSVDTSTIAVVEVGSGCFAVEYLDAASGKTLLAYIPSNGSISATLVSASDAYTPLPTFGTSDNATDLSGIFLAYILQASVADGQIKNVLLVFLAGGAPDALYYFSDVVYYGIQTGALKCNMPGGNIDMLTKNRVAAGAFAGTRICGQPKLLVGAKSKAAKKSSLKFGEAKSEFASFAAMKNWSEKEKRLIPSFPEDYPVPPEALKIARRFVKTSGDKRPMRNFLWRGVTSYGKSTGVELMAGMLNMPLLRVTCNSGMETQSFLSEYVPSTSSIGGFAPESMPTWMEMDCDPAGAWLKLTGEENETATPEECLEEYGKAAARAAATNDNKPMFMLVESNFVKALKKGYMVEIQEISRIKDAGVLVGLNEYDRPGAAIPLVDGTFTRRHPDAMAVYTDNVGYASCRPVDPSVIRRMAFVIDSYELPKETVLSRVIYNTGFSDRGTLDGMYGLWKKVQEYCSEHDITDGTVSVTELEMWVQAIQCDGIGAMAEACRECVVSKATSQIEEQEEIMRDVVDIIIATI